MNINKIITETVNSYINKIINEDITLDRIINKHGDEGFIIVSANRSSLSLEDNMRNKQQLKSEIENSGYSYKMVHGGYHNIDSGEDSDYEPSFLIFNNPKSNNYKPLDFNKLFELGKTWCAEYDQDCFLVKAPDAPAIYCDREGNKVNSKESSTVWKNDPSKEFFTTLRTPEEDSMKPMGKRWTHDIEF